MSDITLSAGVRQNLLSLQSTASLLSTTQNDLATGKKVNTAADNPTNFFTSQSLNNRANDLSSLLDSIGQAQQTLTLADQGITSLTNLVQSAKSIANQALQAPVGTVNYSQITGTQAIAADTTRVTSTATVASAVGGVVASKQSTAALDSTGLSNLSNGDTLTFQLGSGTTYTATFTTSGATGNSFTTAANLQTILSGDFGAAATVTTAAGGVTATSNDVSNNFTIGGTGAAHAQSGNATDFQAVNHTLGDALTITDAAGHSANFYYVAGNASAANGTFTTAADAVAAINNAASNVHTNITATAPGGNLELDATNSITVAGNIGSALGINGTTNANYNSTLAGITGNLTVQVAGNSAHTLTFGAANGQISTKAELTTALGGLTDIGGGLNSTGDIQFTPSSSAAVTIGGTPSTVTALGLSLGTTTPVGTVVTANSTRSSLQTQYNDLLTQMDQLASDSSYNGINLLAGNNLKVTFNETGTSSLTIQGVNFSATGLGLSAIAGTQVTSFNNAATINSTITSLNGAINQVQTQTETFGTNSGVIGTRQTFETNLINTLQTGASNLVVADQNQESADLLTEQTQQQLEISALSIANQANQSVLKLFG
jgi:flagellin